jgi:hypothetical protein
VPLGLGQISVAKRWHGNKQDKEKWILAGYVVKKNIDFPCVVRAGDENPA